MLPLVARPRAAADLAVGRARVEAPHLRAGVRVVRGDRAARAHLAAGHPDDHLPAVVERRHRHRAALLPARIPRAPDDGAGRLVERNEPPGDLGDEDLPVPDRDAAVAEPTAGRRDLRLRDVRGVLPQRLPGRGIEGEDVVVARRDVHHALVDDGCRLLGVEARPAGLQMHLPGELEVRCVRGIDLRQRRVALVRDAPAVRQPIAAGRRSELRSVECRRTSDRAVPLTAYRRRTRENDERDGENDDTKASTHGPLLADATSGFVAFMSYGAAIGQRRARRATAWSGVDDAFVINRAYAPAVGAREETHLIRLRYRRNPCWGLSRARRWVTCPARCAHIFVEPWTGPAPC